MKDSLITGKPSEIIRKNTFGTTSMGTDAILQHLDKQREEELEFRREVLDYLGGFGFT